MIPGHEIDRNLPLRKFFLALASRAVELSRSDAQMRRILNEFGDATGFDYKDESWKLLANQVMFTQEVSKDMAYGVLAIKHMVEYLDYVTMHNDEAKLKGLTEQFRETMEEARDKAEKMARYASGTVLETFDFSHLYTGPVGQSEPTAH